VVSHPGSEESLALLRNHRASVTIHETPGTYIGLSEDVGTCRDVGCTAFAYFVSGELAGLSRPFTIDGTTLLDVWRYEQGDVPDQAVFPTEFVRHGVGMTQFVAATISTATFGLFLARATVEPWALGGEWVPGGSQRRSIFGVSYFLTIPLFAFQQDERASPATLSVAPSRCP
jgi:hypothetical protein